MDKEVVYQSDIFLLRGKPEKQIFWYEILKFQEEENKQFRYIIRYCERPHEDFETLSFNDPSYCLTYVDSQWIRSKYEKQICYHKRAARRAINEKLSSLRRKHKGNVLLMISRSELIEKIDQITNCLQKYIEE